MPPKRWRQLVKEVPQGRCHGFIGVVCRWLSQNRRVVQEINKRLFQERRTQKIRRLRIGEPTRICHRPVKDRRHVRQRLRKVSRIMDKDHLRHRPWAFKALHRNCEIRLNRLALGIDKGPIWQILGIGAKKQISLFHRAEIGAIDPDHVNCTIVVCAGLLFRQNPGDRIGRVSKLHMLQNDTVVSRNPITYPSDKIVGCRRSAPGIPIDCLAIGGGNDGFPIRRVALRQRRKWQRQSCHQCQGSHFCGPL